MNGWGERAVNFSTPTFIRSLLLIPSDRRHHHRHYRQQMPTPTFALLLAVAMLGPCAVFGSPLPPPPPPQGTGFLNSAAVTGNSASLTAQTSCVDSDAKCSLWASQGECHSNAVWMMSNCRRSCQSCQGGDRAWQLRQQLARNYDNATNSINSNATHLVRIESVRLSHLEIDEQRQLVRAFGRMVMSWEDQHVKWDKENWGISWIHFYWIQVWTPQLVQVNAPTSSPGLLTGKVLAANHTGQVFLWTDFAFTAPYHFEYDDYPNDEQRICYKFDDKRFFSVRFVVADEVKSRKHEAIGETHVSGWTVADMELSDSKYIVEVLGDPKQNPFDTQTSNCELCVTLRRNAVYYLPFMLVPALVTSGVTMSAVAFQLSLTQAGMLAFSVVAQLLSMALINSRMPSFTNSTPTILKFAGFNLAATGLLFLASLGLRKLSQANGNIPLPRAIYGLLTFIDRFLPLPKSGKDAEESATGYYADLAHTLNHLLFACAFLVYSLNIFFSFVF